MESSTSLIRCERTDAMLLGGEQMSRGLQRGASRCLQRVSSGMMVVRREDKVGSMWGSQSNERLSADCVIAAFIFPYGRKFGRKSQKCEAAERDSPPEPFSVALRLCCRSSHGNENARVATRSSAQPSSANHTSSLHLFSLFIPVAVHHPTERKILLVRRNAGPTAQFTKPPGPRPSHPTTTRRPSRPLIGPDHFAPCPRAG